MKIRLSNKSNALDLHPKKCAQCGKEFECSTMYAYKRTKPANKRVYVYFCSYSCLRAFDKERETKKLNRSIENESNRIQKAI